MRRAESLQRFGQYRPRVELLGQSEIGYQHSAVVLDEDVLRLDVAVYDARLIGGVTSLGGIGNDACGDLGFNGLGPREPVQVNALHALHGDERPSVCFADFMYRHDARMPQPRDDLRFLAESAQHFRLIGVFVAENLDGKRLRRVVARGVKHVTEPAASDAGAKRVVSKGLGGQWQAVDVA